MNPSHVKVRKRRARIYEQQERGGEALVEYCAVLVADTLDVKRKLEPYKHNPQTLAVMQQQIMCQRMEEQQTVQLKLNELIAVCGKKKSDGILAERKGKSNG